MGRLDEAVLRHGRHDTGAVTLHVVEAGPADGPAVILLHGFPEFWFGWRHQIGALAAAGHRVVVPDQRGYATSDKPEGIDAYRGVRLAGDVVGLADALGIDRFRLVGHDWGGVVAWATAALHPGRVERLAVLNAPHPDTWGLYALTHPTQALRSAYVGLFQLPRLPEALLSAGRHRALRRSLLESSRPGTFTEADLDRYVEAWSKPGAPHRHAQLVPRAAPPAEAAPAPHRGRDAGAVGRRGPLPRDRTGRRGLRALPLGAGAISAGDALGAAR